MSDPKPSSPLLDGFAMGTPMSDHDGVSCCPAIKEDSDKKYIVKIISIPASQAQMDALLLAGAYKDPADAMEYYRVIGEEIMKEAELLTTLSKLDGFLPYDGWQMEPITRRRLGYEIYLVGSYKRSLEKYVQRNPVTHLEAMNMALDMCAALSICRQTGALYVDLKPANIFISEKKEYRIGDLGFIALDALTYTTLPVKYRSQYTPPELFDPMAPLNLTADTYAVGMILYQLYNDGQLPFTEIAPAEALPSPVNADYELAAIIAKAIHPDPEQRWTDPQELGRALVDYMQRNAVNDIPITPHTPLMAEPEPVSAEHHDPEGEAPAETIAASDSEPADTVTSEILEQKDETHPGEEDAQSLQPHEMSDELSRMFAKADDLIAQEPLPSVVVPEIPEPPNPFSFVAEDSMEVSEFDLPLDPVMEDSEESIPVQTKKPEPKFVSQAGKKKFQRFIGKLVPLLVIAALACGIFWIYQNVYLQTIDSITITGERNQLTVQITSSADESLLSVECSDNYGNVVIQPLKDGRAVFADLLPNTMYKIQLKIDGFHGLKGQTSEVFTTDTTTNVVAFTAVTGPKDGSVILNITVDGTEPRRWAVDYGVSGAEPLRETFTGHTITIEGLSLGKIYTFTLDAGDDLSLSGNTTVEFMASRLIIAQNLAVTSTGGSDITVHWNAPGDIVVDSWDVRCYSSNGYDQQLTVSGNEAYFTGLDFNESYTIEIMAPGMTQPARTNITSNPLSITNLQVDSSDPRKLKLDWDYSGDSPDGGWLLMYSIDGVSAIQNVVRCPNSAAEIDLMIPNAKYEFTIQSGDGTTVFNHVHTFETADAERFSDHKVSASEITGYLARTPDGKNWHIGQIGTSAFDNEFRIGENLSAVLYSPVNFYLPGSELEILYVIRDTHGNVLPDLISKVTTTWRDVWIRGDHHYGELDIPAVPEIPGHYILDILFNGKMIAEIGFAIVE